MSKFVSQNLETDVDIRFIKKKLWNGCRHPFHKNNEKKGNGSRHPFLKIMKRILIFVSYENKKIQWISTSVMAHMDYNIDTVAFSIQFHQSPSSFTKNQEKN